MPLIYGQQVDDQTYLNWCVAHPAEAASLAAAQQPAQQQVPVQQQFIQQAPPAQQQPATQLDPMAMAGMPDLMGMVRCFVPMITQVQGTTLMTQLMSILFQSLASATKIGH